MSIDNTKIKICYPQHKEMSCLEFENHVNSLRRKRLLWNLTIPEILDSLDYVSGELSKRDSELAKAYGENLVSYLSSFLSSGNLKGLIKVENIDLGSFDGFVKVSERKSIRRVPKGVVSQWIAGNVPFLGILTLTLSLLSKNINVIRLSSRQDDYLKPFLDLLASSGKTGKLLSENSLLIQYDYTFRPASETHSRIADCRLMFGNQEAVENIRTFARSWKTEDIILGPRISMGVIDPNFISAMSLNRLAGDILLFDQLACTSPQFIFIKDSDKTETFASQLFKAMGGMASRFPRHFLNYSETSDICEGRASLIMNGAKLLTSAGTALTIAVQSELRERSICGNNFLQLIRFKRFEEIYPYIPSNIQSVVTCLSKDDFFVFTEQAARHGVCRFPIIGETNYFEIPWDGIELLHRLSNTAIRTDP